MKYYDRSGKLVSKDDKLNTFLTMMYKTRVRRSIMKLFTSESFSNIVGYILDSGVSKILINPFIKANNIDMNEFEERNYKSYNDFFTRKIKDGKRKFSDNPEDLCSPCDGKLQVFKITKKKFKIKGTDYSLESLLRNKKLAKRYKNGHIAIFRLSVDNYHRYAYIDDGIKSKNYSIPGFLYSVDPAVIEKVPVYKENKREFCLLKTKNFGTVLHMEVGATIVGKISNYHEQFHIKRGMEKGMFEFGGSTIVLIFQKNKVKFNPRYIDSKYEHEVYMGDIINN